jgi:hypothetical protein
VDFAATEVDPGVAWYLYPRLGYIPYAHTVRAGKLGFCIIEHLLAILLTLFCVCAD